MAMSVLRLLFLWGVVLLASPVGAAEDALVTDRPDFTESALAVDTGRWQFEMGASYDDGANATAWSAGELLVRWGVARDFELRLGAVSYLWVDQVGDDSSGFLDPSIGMKYEINDGDSQGFWGGTGLAVIAATTIPVGASAVSSPDWQPLVVLAASWDLAPSLSLGTNLGYARPSDGDDRFDSFWLSLALGVGITDRTSAFFELYGFDREEDRGPSTAVFQTGLTYLINSNVQLDGRVARRLTDAGPDFLLGVGVSWRY